MNEHIKDKTLTRTVDRYTRAGRYGKNIVCPECNSRCTVYHFSWSALSCQECGAMVEKNQWTYARIT